MRFADMLRTKVESLADRVHTTAAIERAKLHPQQPSGKKYTRNVANANKRKHEISLARYKEAMRGEWTPTVVIESRLGMGRSCCLPTLNDWLHKGLIMKRENLAGGETWNRNKGYEWKFPDNVST